MVIRTEGGQEGAAQSRERSARVALADTWPVISVCVCTHARPHYLAKCLDGLRTQTIGADAFEVIVVDSGSPPSCAAMIAELASSFPNARLLRLDEAGVSVARNAGARAATGDYVAYIDDDAVAAPDWVEQIRRVIQEEDRPPAVVGGRVLPLWEQPLPDWWPESLRGVLSIIEFEGKGEYRTPDLPAGMSPWSVNMVIDRAAMLQLGGFDERLGRYANLLLSDEDVQLAWRLQESGRSARYDSRIVVRHSIQAERLSPEWLVARLYWQGFSTVVTRRLMREQHPMKREFRRRLAVEALCTPAALLPRNSTRLLALRWRLAYAKGFTRAALGCVPGKRARLLDLAMELIGRRADSPSAPLFGGVVAAVGEPGVAAGYSASEPMAGREAKGVGQRDTHAAC